MLYNTTRERLLQLGQGYSALVADALYFMGWSAGETFTVEQAISALKPLGTSVKIIRAALKNPIFNPQGRRNRRFTLPDPNDARRIIGANVLRLRDVLSSGAFKSLTDYRKALHAALVKRRPGVYFRAVLARRLGVCKQTTRNYDKALGHQVTEQHTSRDVTHADLNAMPEKKVTGGSRKYWLAKRGLDGFIDAHAPLVKAIALKWLSEGFKVEILEQTASNFQPSFRLHET